MLRDARVASEQKIARRLRRRTIERLLFNSKPVRRAPVRSSVQGRRQRLAAAVTGKAGIEAEGFSLFFRELPDQAVCWRLTARPDQPSQRSMTRARSLFGLDKGGETERQLRTTSILIVRRLDRQTRSNRAVRRLHRRQAGLAGGSRSLCFRFLNGALGRSCLDQPKPNSFWYRGMKRSLPLIADVKPSPTTKPPPIGSTLAPMLGPSGSRMGAVFQGA